MACVSSSRLAYYDEGGLQATRKILLLGWVSFRPFQNQYKHQYFDSDTSSLLIFLIAFYLFNWEKI